MRLKIVFGIHRATHRIGLYIQRHEPDLTQAEAHILCHLHETGDSAVADLHRAFAHKRSTLTSVLDRLESRAWITRQTSRQDRRSFIIGLTRAGKAKAAKIHRVLEQLEAGALRGTDPDDVARCNQLLSKVEELSEQ
jgi:DNA-binding MarR family transcriptional regulator